MHSITKRITAALLAVTAALSCASTVSADSSDVFNRGGAITASLDRGITTNSTADMYATVAPPINEPSMFPDDILEAYVKDKTNTVYADMDNARFIKKSDIADKLIQTHDVDAGMYNASPASKEDILKLPSALKKASMLYRNIMNDTVNPMATVKNDAKTGSVVFVDFGNVEDFTDDDTEDLFSDGNTRFNFGKANQIYGNDLFYNDNDGLKEDCYNTAMKYFELVDDSSYAGNRSVIESTIESMPTDCDSSSGYSIFKSNLQKRALWYQTKRSAYYLKRLAEETEKVNKEMQKALDDYAAAVEEFNKQLAAASAAFAEAMKNYKGEGPAPTFSFSGTHPDPPDLTPFLEQLEFLASEEFMLQCYEEFFNMANSGGYSTTGSMYNSIKTYLQIKDTADEEIDFVPRMYHEAYAWYYWVAYGITDVSKEHYTFTIYGPPQDYMELRQWLINHDLYLVGGSSSSSSSSSTDSSSSDADLNRKLSDLELRDMVTREFEKYKTEKRSDGMNTFFGKDGGENLYTTFSKYVSDCIDNYFTPQYMKDSYIIYSGRVPRHITVKELEAYEKQGYDGIPKTSDSDDDYAINTALAEMKADRARVDEAKARGEEKLSEIMNLYLLMSDSAETPRFITSCSYPKNGYYNGFEQSYVDPITLYGESDLTKTYAPIFATLFTTMGGSGSFQSPSTGICSQERLAEMGIVTNDQVRSDFYEYAIENGLFTEEEIARYKELPGIETETDESVNQVSPSVEGKAFAARSTGGSNPGYTLDKGIVQFDSSRLMTLFKNMPKVYYSGGESYVFKSYYTGDYNNFFTMDTTTKLTVFDNYEYLKGYANAADASGIGTGSKYDSAILFHHYLFDKNPYLTFTSLDYNYYTDLKAIDYNANTKMDDTIFQRYEWYVYHNTSNSKSGAKIVYHSSTTQMECPFSPVEAGYYWVDCYQSSNTTYYEDIMFSKASFLTEEQTRTVLMAMGSVFSQRINEKNINEKVKVSSFNEDGGMHYAAGDKAKFSIHNGVVEAAYPTEHMAD